jgi:predicted nucleic acid-binding protein
VNLYFDSAYVAKCYVLDGDAERIRELAISATRLTSSALAVAEVAGALHRKCREGVLAPSQLSELLELFAEERTEGRWRLLPVTTEILREVGDEYRRLPCSTFLRSADAIHLVTARRAGFREIWSNDRHLLAAAAQFGLQARSVR